MNIKLIKLLASVCISLCVIIAGEWLYASYSQHRLLTSVSSAEQKDSKTDELPEIELTKQPEESYVDLVARPLFIEGRKPVNEPSPEAAQAAAKSIIFDWQLTGVYSTKKTVSALFSRSKSKVAKDNHRKITVGDDIDGWKLAEINKDRVILKQDGSEKELLLRKPKLKALPPAAKSTKPAVPAPDPTAIPEPATDTNEPAIDTNEPAEDISDGASDTSENE